MAKSQTRKKPKNEIHRTSKTTGSGTGSSHVSHQVEKQEKPAPTPTASWVVMKSILTCKHLQVEQQQQQQNQKVKQQQQQPHHKQKKKKLKVKQKQPEQQQQKEREQEEVTVEDSINSRSKKSKKMRCTAGASSLCNNTKVMQRPTQQQEHHSNNSPDPLLHTTRRSLKPSSSSSSLLSTATGSANDGSNRSLTSSGGGGSSSTTSSSSYSVTSSRNNNTVGNGGAFKGMPFRRLSGCYECRMVVDPVLGFSRDPSLRATICSCSDCGEIFMKPEYLELHQATRHAVSELGPEDTSKNIVEIIFQSSWLRKHTTTTTTATTIPTPPPTPAAVCKIERILKVHNTSKTISKFEEYRDTIKLKATATKEIPNPLKQYPRCVADGNELLRFHCTTFICSLGLNGMSNLCNQIPNCNVCGIIRNGFRVKGNCDGILTTATSGRAHDKAEEEEEKEKEKEECKVVKSGSGGVLKRAMLVCRVIAGRVKKSGVESGSEEFDSVAGVAGVYSNLDELYVFNPRAILPCFVVVYNGF